MKDERIKDKKFVQRTVAQIAWRANLSLLDKLSSPDERLWYARETARNGWSKEWLDICIESRMMDRVGKAPSNFPKTLSLDLLFYHLKLRCFVVVELKVGKFDPGDAAQLGFYQTVVDHTMRHQSDAPTIGLLLVREKNDTIVRYSLEGMRSPMGVAEWQTAIEKSMPEDMKSVLPTIEAIEAEMSEVDSHNSAEEHETAVPSIPFQHPASCSKKDRGKSKRRKGGKKP